MNHPDLTVTLGRLKLANPVMTASGTFGYGEEYDGIVDLNRLGALVVKGISLRPRPGNPPPRIVETAAGMLNAIGLQNVGLTAFIRDKLPYLRHLVPALVVNILGETEDEYVEIAAALSDQEGVDAIELNISCPNVAAGGLIFGTDAEATSRLTARVRAVTKKTLLVKLTPNVADITVMAKAAADAGADGLTVINTLLGLAIDLTTRRPRLANITGGLSGPAIKPVALRMVWQVARAVDVPVIGVGGISTWQDAVEFFIAGATAIQIGTANFFNPTATMDVLEGITGYLTDCEVAKLTDLIGTLRLS
ncbi:MAG: dihydroorotate dehydrogenase [Deltaproteobacteria bacterium]|nr:dihydroorotate dehydrogenase [Deltaproteobacteria bacterium]